MELIIQPYQNKLGKLLTDDLASKRYSSFIISAAYARVSGIGALYDAILAFRGAGGTVYAAIGIDQGNTSYEALRAALRFTEELYIFHNRSLSSTFHPKAYILMGEKHGKIYVGSNNLTNGGLYSNYEVAACQEFDLTAPASAEEFANMVRALGGFRQEGPCCKKATDELIEKLYEAHMVCTECEIRAVSARAGAAKAGADGAALFGSEPVTGSASRYDFGHLAPAVQIRGEYETAAAGGAEDPSGREAAEEDAGQVRSFYKRLSKNDVDLKSSPGQIIIPIAFKTFFEPFSEPQRTKAGAMQSERYFNLKYENSGEIVENARVIFYVPSPEHPRKNSEVRFALRNRAIFNTFEQDDVLVFTQAPRSGRGQYVCTVKRIAHDSPDGGAYPGRFAWIAK